MNETFNLLTKFAPEIIDLLERRYNILRAISHNQPIGRRLLAEQLRLGERTVRGEQEFFKNQQFLVREAAGVSLTAECESLLNRLGNLLHKLRGLVSLEISLAQKTGLKKVHVVQGDTDEDSTVLRELGKQAGRFIHDVIQDNWIVAVTGGITMAEVAANIPKSSVRKNVLVVPARGGLGEDVQIQANTVAAVIAQSLGAVYRLLHVPDAIAGETLENLLADKRVQEVISLLRRANLLVHGIGIPEVMAKRRCCDWQEILKTMDKKPVGEAFGNYFAADGSVVMTTPTVGPTLAELARLDLVVAVAGGHSKAEAVLTVLKAGFIDVLITDQAAAECMLKILDGRLNEDNG